MPKSHSFFSMEYKYFTAVVARCSSYYFIFGIEKEVDSFESESLLARHINSWAASSLI